MASWHRLPACPIFFFRWFWGKADDRLERGTIPDVTLGPGLLSWFGQVGVLSLSVVLIGGVALWAVGEHASRYGIRKAVKIAERCPMKRMKLIKIIEASQPDTVPTASCRWVSDERGREHYIQSFIRFGDPWNFVL